MKILLLVTLLFACLNPVISQKHDYNWVTGYDSFRTNPLWGGASFDFSMIPPKIFNHPRKMDIFWVNTVMSDSTGALLFYSNGCDIANAKDTIMENGNGINPGFVHSIKCNDDETYTSGRQSMISLPSPEDNSLFYVFHEGITYVEEPVFDVLTDVLYFSLVDVSKNNGEGAVLVKNQPIIKDSLNWGEITAVKH